MQCNLQYEAAVRTHETHKLRVPQACTHLDWQRPGVAQQNTPLVVVVGGNGTKVAHGMRLVGEFRKVVVECLCMAADGYTSTLAAHTTSSSASKHADTNVAVRGPRLS